ncbi:RteC domain-containing protein [Emticicia aquatica]|uniref:RteC domain-containing protein n=1 Tax=Emticicia aquatica TaxID=1681835 RepID=UPI00286D8085|nr:RteC domain-containing protein [Emticicia aquatica]
MEEEIYFFKFIKPKFQSKLIFYLKWNDIQIRKVAYENNKIVKYYQKECRKLKHFLKENINFQYKNNNDLTTINH